MNAHGDADSAGAGHRPVLAEEVVRELITNPQGIYLDATVGGGGHAELILDRLQDKGRLVGLDRDPEAVSYAVNRLSRFGSRVVIRHADYRTLTAVLEELGIRSITGALFDLGISSLQLDDARRGFGYRLEGPLDLRFDPSRGRSAAEWLADASAETIATILRTYGEERHARRLARLIIAARTKSGGGIATTADLARIIARVAGSRGDAFGRTAARVFQALRIVVNDELAAIPVGIEAALDRLSVHGRLVVIAYHSLEDRTVKTILREASRPCSCSPALGQCVCGARPRGRLVHKRVLRPGAQEVAVNPRARAARLRVFEKMAVDTGENS